VPVVQISERVPVVRGFHRFAYFHALRLVSSHGKIAHSSFNLIAMFFS
jgi:hypothetical protein